MTSYAQAIVGPSVANQVKLRPPKPVRDLDEFLEFLREVEALWGPSDAPRPLAEGSRFRL